MNTFMKIFSLLEPGIEPASTLHQVLRLRASMFRFLNSLQMRHINIHGNSILLTRSHASKFKPGIMEGLRSRTHIKTSCRATEVALSSFRPIVVEVSSLFQVPATCNSSVLINSNITTLIPDEPRKRPLHPKHDCWTKLLFC